MLPVTSAAGWMLLAAGRGQTARRRECNGRLRARAGRSGARGCPDGHLMTAEVVRPRLLVLPARDDARDGAEVGEPAEQPHDALGDRVADLLVEGLGLPDRIRDV